jgi:hypothetical protein
MDSAASQILRSANAFAATRGLVLENQLGFGKDGIVWATDRATVVKAFERAERWEREVAVYQRLQQCGVRAIRGHAVPRMRHSDRPNLVIEMTLVHRPFLLDFATAQLDEPLDFPPDILEEWERDKAEQFGANWPAARSVLAALEGRCGIYMLDVHPGNIGFPDS